MVRGSMPLFLSGTVADKHQSWPLEAASLTIGRSSRNAIQITDGTVSKEHAEIARDGERWTIRDLGSRNGTRVNGVEARGPVPLSAGDRVEIGHVALAVTDGQPSTGIRINEATVMGSSLRL